MLKGHANAETLLRLLFLRDDFPMRSFSTCIYLGVWRELSDACIERGVLAFEITILRPWRLSVLWDMALNSPRRVRKLTSRKTGPGSAKLRLLFEGLLPFQ